MSSRITKELRNLVNKRAHDCCEYCLLPQIAVFHKHEPDHIVPSQHGGATEANNLALSCMRCNRYKGPNVGSIDPQTKELVPFFNPRTQVWKKHFELNGAVIEPLTAEARVTIKILRINDESRILEREMLLEAGLY